MRFAHEVHPSEIAYDYWTTVARAGGDRAPARPSASTGTRRTSCGRTSTPSASCWDFKDRIYHVDCKDAKQQVGNGRNGRMGSHLAWADPRRGWDFVSTGHGDVPWEASFRMLNTIGYDGPISVEWEDAGMDRLRRCARGLGVRPAPRLRRALGGVRRRLLHHLLRPPAPGTACGWWGRSGSATCSTPSVRRRPRTSTEGPDPRIGPFCVRRRVMAVSVFRWCVGPVRARLPA